jgi:hypothetical protein
MKRLLLIVGIGLLSACGGHSLQGSIALHSIGTFGSKSIGENCFGTGGYNDLAAGAQVTIRDETGKVLATGHLDEGKTKSASECDFAFNLDVPDAKFYQVEVSHRGQVTYSADDLEKAGWRVQLTLGS